MTLLSAFANSTIRTRLILGFGAINLIFLISVAITAATVNDIDSRIAALAAAPGNTESVRAASLDDLEHAQKRSDTLIWLLTGLVATAALSATAIVLLTSHSIAGPIAELTQAMSRLAEGDTSVAVPGTDKTHEIGQMAKALEIFRGNAIERHAAESAVRESELRYRRLVELEPNAVYVACGGKIVFANPAAERMFRALPHAPIVGRPARELVHPEYRAMLDTPEQTPSDGFIASKHCRLNGQDFYSEVAWTPFSWNGITARLIVVRDISDLKEFQLELQRSNAELEQFAFIASHDLQEPLRKVQAFGDRLKAKHADALPAEGRDYIERMQSAAKRMSALIEGLLTFSRVSTKGQPFEAVNLADIVSEVTADLEIRMQEAKAAIDCGALPVIDADPLQMRQLFQNLIGNALKYRRDGTPTAIRIDSEVEQDDTVPGTPRNGAAPGLCRIRIADNGIGFDPKYAERIFGIYQRLHGKGVYEGTGVGLAICRKIAERHGGTIVADGAPGDGAVFTVTLPIRQQLRDAA